MMFNRDKYSFLCTVEGCTLEWVVQHDTLPPRRYCEEHNPNKPLTDGVTSGKPIETVIISGGWNNSNQCYRCKQNINEPHFRYGNTAFCNSCHEKMMRRLSDLSN